jgi:hypothetical protein
MVAKVVGRLIGAAYSTIPREWTLRHALPFNKTVFKLKNNLLTFLLFKM